MYEHKAICGPWSTKSHFRHTTQLTPFSHDGRSPTLPTGMNANSTTCLRMSLLRSSCTLSRGVSLNPSRVPTGECSPRRSTHHRFLRYTATVTSASRYLRVRLCRSILILLVRVCSLSYSHTNDLVSRVAFARDAHVRTHTRTHPRAHAHT